METQASKDKSLRIAHLHWGFPPIIGGVETHLSIMLPEIVRQGHTVGLLTGAVEDLSGESEYRGVRLFRTPLMDLNWLYKRGLKGLEDELRETLHNFLNETRPQVIHAHNMHYFSELHAKLLEEEARRRKAALILTAHNVWDDLLFVDLSRKIKWDHIISVSHFIKREMMGVGIDDQKISVVYHGIDTDRYRPDIPTDAILRKYPQLSGRKVVFHPARMGLAKGCDVSVKAMNIVKDRFPDALLVLAGTRNIVDWGATQEKDIAYIVNLLDFFGLRDNTVVDVFSMEEVAQIYGLAQVCIYPSSSPEPFGLTMLEALATEKPMVVTNTGGMPEIIRDGINGYVIPVKDFEALAFAINRLLADGRLRKRLGSTGRQMVESSYTKEVMTKNVLKIYRKILG